MPSAPAKETRVGVRLLPHGRWLPMIAHKLLPDGSMTFRWPDRMGRGERMLAAFKLTHTDWEWKPAAECEFQRACPTCRGNGARMVDGFPKICQDCKGHGEQPDRRPFA